MSQPMKAATATRPHVMFSPSVTLSGPAKPIQMPAPRIAAPTARRVPPAPHRPAGPPGPAPQTRAHRRRLSELAFSEALRSDPTLRERYDERALRIFYRDYERHFEQLARALSAGSGEPGPQYGEWLPPPPRPPRGPGPRAG